MHWVENNNSSLFFLNIQHASDQIWTCPVCVWQLGTCVFVSRVRLEVRVVCLRDGSWQRAVSRCCVTALWWDGVWVDEAALCRLHKVSASLLLALCPLSTTLFSHTHTHTTIYTVLHWSIVRRPEWYILHVIPQNPCVNKTSGNTTNIRISLFS